MSDTTYVMRDQARDTVHEIMRGPGGPIPGSLLQQPSWLALGLLVVALNILALATPA